MPLAVCGRCERPLCSWAASLLSVFFAVRSSTCGAEGILPQAFFYDEERDIAMGKKLPRAAAVHDVSGFGKCALTIAIPVLSACGVEVCPLPTAVLSANTDFQGFQMVDLTEAMSRFLTHWEEMGLCFDAVYSGFLGSAMQIDDIERMVRRFRPALTLIDPVCGDEGVVYKTYTREMCERLRQLVRIADVVTPNLTEACVLTGTDYAACGTQPAEIRALAEQIRASGAKSVIITGVERGESLYNCILDSDGYDERRVPLLPFRMHGTGDLFSSVLAGGLMTGHTLRESVDSAARFVALAMQASAGYDDSMRRGVCFEPHLALLAGGLCAE